MEYTVTDIKEQVSKLQPGREMNQDAVVTLWENGNRLEIRERTPVKSKERIGGGARKEVTHFSRKSRRSLIKALTATDRKAKFVFVTLTYQENQTNAETAKRHLHAFLERLRNAYTNVSGFWKLERQKRGAIHFHLILFAKWIDRTWIASNWDRIAGNQFGESHSVSTEVRRPRIEERAKRYIFAYMGKHESNGKGEEVYPGKVGRYWGVHGRENIPFAVIKNFPVSNETAARFLIYFSEKTGVPFDLRSITLFLDNEIAKWVEGFLNTFRVYSYG